MHLPIKNICVLGILPFALTLWNCTTEGETVTVGEDELSEVYIINESVFDEDSGDEEDEDEEEIESSSSKKTDSGKSSSSKKSSAKSSSSKKVSSSSKKADSSSSSEKEAKSSSSARLIQVPGMDDTKKSSSSKAKSSSSKAKSSSSKAKSSSSVKEESSSSLSESDNATFESMEKLSSNEKKEITDLIKAKDSTVTMNESTALDLSSLNFEENDYLCNATDGNWYRITENTLDSITKSIFGRPLKITNEYYYDFVNVCKEIYNRAK
ncbi:MAG: hypothetical protein J5615_00545 [Fibrobacter sp.]|nr:hypothetical protein [Fibrobacter sp.]